jgi:hypothetical protein
MIAECTFRGSLVKRGRPCHIARWGWLERGAERTHA